jgi:hypothetical protein
MKFGALWIDKLGLGLEIPINIGNEIQHFYSIIQLLMEMGVVKEDLIPIKNSERSLLSFDGEEIIHPMNEAMFDNSDDRRFAKIFPLPNHIKPVILALSFCGRTELYPEAIEYLKKCEPIGCRDEYTLRLLEKCGIESYLFGCISLTQTQRSIGNYDKIYANDLPDGLIDYIPFEIREQLTYESQMFPDENKFSHDPLRRYRLAETVINRWRNTAKLVICSKLHTVIPCIAMGVPVVFVADNHSSRFGWIDKHLKIYTRSKWNEIDWTPAPIDVEHIKQLMRMEAKRAVMSVILGKRRNATLLRQISEYWLDRKRPVRYDNFAYDVISTELVNFPKNMEFIIWGVGLIGEQTYQAMSSLFPKAKFLFGVDSFARGIFHEKEIFLPEKILETTNAIVLVATYTGREYVLNWMNKHKKEMHSDFILLSSTQG